MKKEDPNVAVGATKENEGSRTIRITDLKRTGGHSPGKDATPAIKTGKTVFLMPSRPAIDVEPLTVPGGLSKGSALKPAVSIPLSEKPATVTAQSTKVEKPSKKKIEAPKPAEAQISLSNQLTAESLPRAVGQLFELNNYSVKYGDKIHGSEVDLIATPKGDPFGATVYIEVTVQYVDVTKYGKDLTKFTLVREIDAQCTCICVSTSGFTADVRERAGKTRIVLRTYDELFAQFEKFTPYVEKSLERDDLLALVETYEEPSFRDDRGQHQVIAWLNEWKDDSKPSANWLVVLGEYGTGKTALTLRMQYEWLRSYKSLPQHPIPIRIELKNFSRQFDSRSLLHYFLDTNSLGHISIDFLLYLIRNRRVILLLDGYDEMAQFLNARERRACLAALAELAGEGAKGILTSRPNYFTENEELHVFDALYTSLEQNHYFMGQIDKLFLAQEQSIDKLLDRYLLNKNERYLRDLTPEQTKALIHRKLADNPAGEKIVLELLDKVFREESGGTRQSLSGKPVIISYLLELVDFLVNDSPDTSSAFNEWQIYKLIVDRLMWRDLQRSPTLPMEQRRTALQRLAILLSGKSTTGANEGVFFSIIDDLFRSELRRLTPEEQRSRRDELFQDLRSSTTLTRSESASPSVWYFSHNSLREFLVTEAAVAALYAREPLDFVFPISLAMRSFVAALPPPLSAKYIDSLRDLWPKKAIHKLGGSFVLGFELLKAQKEGLRRTIATVTSGGEGRVDLSNISLKEIELCGADLGERVEFVCIDSILTDVTFRGLDMRQSNFKGTTFDRCSFIECDLSESSFHSTLIFECNFNRVEVTRCDFQSMDMDSNIIAATAQGDPIVLAGRSAVGYLSYHGAVTDETSAYQVLQHDPRFSIVMKICENIAEQRNSQLRGLTQRGAAQADPPFARKLIECLRKADLIEVDQNDLVSATPNGRTELTRLINHAELPAPIEQCLRAQKAND